MRARVAEECELKDIFSISFEIWPRGKNLEEHFQGCFNHSNYRQGEWHVLGARGDLRCVLILYAFDPKLKGIGTVMTPARYRGQGYATKLIEQVIEQCDSIRPPPNILLFSEISPAFYERLGFRSLPPRFQKKEGTSCMIRFAHGVDQVGEYPEQLPDPF